MIINIKNMFLRINLKQDLLKMMRMMVSMQMDLLSNIKIITIPSHTRITKLERMLIIIRIAFNKSPIDSSLPTL